MTGIAGGKTKAPISSHPVFPAIVALWFAALLGLGSFVLPVILLEKLVALSGLDAVLAAAQPPLGFTARMLIALAAAAVGVVVGLFIARQVVAAQAAERPTTAEESESLAEGKRPISALEELGVSRLDEPVQPAMAPAEDDMTDSFAGRRRPLLLPNDEAPRDFFGHAPLPGSAPFAPPVDELDLAMFPEHEYEPAAPEIGGYAPFEGLPAAEQEASDFPRQDFAAPRAAAGAEEPRIHAWVEPVEESPMPQDIAQLPAEPVHDAAPAADPEAGLLARPLNELGLVELVERFATSLQRRIDCNAEEEAEAEPEPDSQPGALSLPRLREDDQPPARPSDPVAMPAALRPIQFDDEAEGDADEPFLTAPFSHLSLAPASAEELAAPSESAAPAANENAGSAGPADEPDEQAEDDSARYSSLLAMKGPFSADRRPAAPAADGPSRDPFSQPPRMAWSSQPPVAEPAMPRAMRDPGETERALRSALEKLQKMSGAA